MSNHDEIQKAQKILESIGTNEKDRMMYLARVKEINDERARRDCEERERQAAEKRAETRGEARGEEKKEAELVRVAYAKLPDVLALSELLNIAPEKVENYIR